MSRAAKPYSPGATYPSTKALQKMTAEEYEKHWAKICAALYDYEDPGYYTDAEGEEFAR